jgi:hypothetical protein
MNVFYEILLASVLPITYLYSQFILQIDKGTFGLIPIFIGEIVLGIMINKYEKKLSNSTTIKG